MLSTSDPRQKSPLKKFHVLCHRLGMDNEARREVTASYGVESSGDLSVAQLADVCSRLESALNPNFREMDVCRKRLISAIGRWLRAMRRTENIQAIKAVACRAAKTEDFNRIPHARLVSLYNAFNNKCKDMDAVGYMTVEQMIEFTIMN
jgi:hypothetical protein